MNNITSPRIDDAGIEQQIQAKGLNAPRVTPTDIMNAVGSVHFFTAAHGCIGNVESVVSNDELDSLDLLTFCVIILKNGFTVTGESACASPENFDEQIGRNIAYANAKQKIWPLEGYLLKQKLHAEGLTA